MCHSMEPRDRILVKCYGFLSFSNNIGKNLSCKCTPMRATKVVQDF